MSPQKKQSEWGLLIFIAAWKCLEHDSHSIVFLGFSALSLIQPANASKNTDVDAPQYASQIQPSLGAVLGKLVDSPLRN